MSSRHEKKTAKKELLAKGRYLSLVKLGHYEFAERIFGTGVVVMFPVTDDGKVVLVEQYRAAIGSKALELPAGLVDDEASRKGESFEDAARSELHEETGYEAARLEFVTEFATSSGMTSERVSLYFANGLKKTGPGGGDASEQITVHEVPLADLVPWLWKKQSEGFALDYKIFAAAYLHDKFVSNDQ